MKNGPSKSLVNDLHYFDLEVERWQEVNSTWEPSRRWRHSAVVDAHHRMWIFGGETVMGDGWIKLADLYSLNLSGATSPRDSDSSDFSSGAVSRTSGATRSQ